MGVLRVILALVVVAGHNQLAHVDIATGVLVAVKAFFIISGFYMALILCERYNDTRLSVFWANRLLRLMPIYYVVMAITFVALALSPTATLGVLLDLGTWQKLLAVPGWKWLKGYLAFTNLSAIGIETTIYACFDLPAGKLHPFINGCTGDILNRFVLIPQAWSISVELFFYALVPFIVRSNNRQLGVMLGAFAMVRVALVVAGLNYNPWNRSVAPFEMIYFLLGVASYRLYAHTRDWRLPAWVPPAVTLGVWVFTIGLAPLSTALGLSAMRESGLWWVYLLTLALTLPLVFRASRQSRVDNAIGELSYPIYLCHVLVLGLFDQYGGKRLHDAVGGHLAWQLLNIGTVLLLSQALVTFIAKPIDRYRRTRLEAARARASQLHRPSAPAVSVG